jgi:thiamine-phosphate diphosphorylase
LREPTRQHGALLFVNDRVDVALAAGADGVHLGPTDLPVHAARQFVPPDFLIGFSTDDPEHARAAERDGASYIGCGAVFGTSSKPEVEGERIGVERLDRVARDVGIPVVGIGGITPANVHEVAATAAAGCAVIGAVMAAADPGDATRRLLRAFTRIACVLAVLCAGAGCDRGPSLDARPPDLAEDTDVPPDLPPSVLNVPVTYDLAPILEKLETIVPRRMGALDERHTLPSNRRVTYAFEAARDRFRADLDGDTARLSAIVHYRGRGWYDPPVGPTISASCGAGENDQRPRAVLALSAPITMGPDWTLRARSRVHRVAPATSTARDRCRITFVRVDITGRLMDAVEGLLRDHTDEIDRALAGVELRSKFEGFWRLLETPIELTDSIWLVIDPQHVRKGGVAADSLEVTVTVGLTARPRIVIGPRPAVTYTALPALDSGRVVEGVHVLVDGRVDYAVASGFISEQVVGRTFERANREVEITSARLYGIGGGRLALELGLRGAARGKLYFVGTPRLDPISRQVTVPDLDVELASRDLLLRGLAWLGQGTVVDFLRERARFPVDDPIELGRKYLHEGLNRDLSSEVHLSGEVLDVRPIGVHATRAALLIRAMAQASAQLTIRKPDSAGVVAARR